ncbi:MAG: NADPH-dependent FMN reductase [Phycisphaerales bacterium]
MGSARVLVITGSTRAESWNRKLARAAAAAVRAAGGIATDLEPRDFALPIYDGDLEAASGLPERVLALKALFRDHNALLIASPEYNSSISAYLKNLIDWVSRSAPGEAGLASFTGKTAALLGASTGALGGLRGLVHLRMILGNIGVTVIPDQLAVNKANEAFNPDGTLKDKPNADRLAAIAARLVRVTSALS